jgi:hypothetical protein
MRVTLAPSNPLGRLQYQASNRAKNITYLQLWPRQGAGASVFKICCFNRETLDMLGHSK